MSRHSGKSKRVYGGPNLPLPVKAPSAFVKKETVPQSEPSNIQQIENVYEFFTKQRPLAWNYYSSTVYDGLFTTGSSWGDPTNSPTSIVLTELDVNEALVLSYLEANIIYRPIPDGTAVSDIQDGYFVALDSHSIPVGRTIGVSATTRTGFVFDLRAQESSLYEASLVVPNTAGTPGILRDRQAPTGGFTRLNVNVLEAAENSTALYIFETGPVSLEYLCIDISSGSGNVPRGFFPYGLAWTLPAADSRICPLVTFDVRGYKINKNDAELLKTLVQNN